MEFQVILGLISSFLSNRWLQVVLDGNSSQEYPVNAGVPEGSILGLALFLLYINDLPDDVICNITICADECILYSMWLGNWFLATTRIGFLTGIWPMRRCGLGQEVACWFQCWKNSVSFVWSIQKHWCYWCENVWVSSWRKKSSFKMLVLTFSSKLYWGSALICSMKFLSSEFALYLYKSNI